MLPGAHQGNSNQSELFNSLKPHLNNRNRLQPFIGLSSIIECVNGGTPQRDAFYICEVCVCRLDKADMRNHIMGSLHRYKYIKARHSELVSNWGENTCLSKLAWPLMDIAKKIEEKEGPGNVQALVLVSDFSNTLVRNTFLGHISLHHNSKVVEFDKASYQHMESQSNNAENVIHFLRDNLSESEPEISEIITSKIWDQTKSPSQRIVLYSPRKKSEKFSTEIQNSPQHSNVSPSLPDAFKDCRSSSSFLSGYTGQAPLTGLVRVVECKSEDGQTSCFLCHCCRVRSHKHDFIDHLISTSHITNYLMETHPEQLESVDINDCYQVELLAQNLKKEHTTELKVVQIPESLCIQMLGRSYHWCVKTLGCNNSDFPVKYNRDVKRPRESNAVQLQQEKKKKQKTHKKNPVFKVTLPVTQGSLLIERTSFSKDDLPLSLTNSPAADLGPSPSSDSKYSQDPQDFNLDCSSEFFYTTSENTSLDVSSQLYDPPEHANEYIKQEMDFRNDQWINQFKDQNVDSKTNIASKVGLCAEDLNAHLQKENAKGSEDHALTLSHSEYWPSSSFLCPVGTREKEGCAVGNPYYHQQPQYSVPDYFHQQHMYSSGYFVGGCRINPQAGDSFSHNNSITLTDHSQSHSSCYTEYGANTHHYSSYQVSSSGWAAYQSQASVQTQRYGPCCVPPYTGTGYAGGISGNAYETGSSSAMYNPMFNFYSSHGCPN